MIGVSLTVMSIVKVLHGKRFALTPHSSPSRASSSLMSTFCAYVALRQDRPSKIDAVAEYLFLGGLVLVTVAGFLLAIAII